MEKNRKKNILRGNTNPMTVRSNLLFNFNLILTQRFLQFSDNGVGFNIFSFDLSKDSQRKRKNNHEKRMNLILLTHGKIFLTI